MREECFESHALRARPRSLFSPARAARPVSARWSLSAHACTEFSLQFPPRLMEIVLRLLLVLHASHHEGPEQFRPAGQKLYSCKLCEVQSSFVACSLKIAFAVITPRQVSSLTRVKE